MTRNDAHSALVLGVGTGLAVLADYLLAPPGQLFLSTGRWDAEAWALSWEAGILVRVGMPLAFLTVGAWGLWRTH